MEKFNNLLTAFCKLDAKPNTGAVTAKAGSKKTAEIDLYGVIGGYTANLSQFKRDLDSARNADNITVYLNTIGGTFADGLPIFNLINQHKAHITVKVMGYALSIGSVIMLAADRVECAENGLIMLHRAQGFTYGDAAEHDKTAQILQKHEDAVIPLYMRKLGKTESQVRDILQAETWYTAKEAKAAGLVDAITNKVDETEASEQAGMEAGGRVIMNSYRHTPQSARQQNSQRWGHYS